jgi:DNA helicase II / ATP-dependent DNA helicase PcrA
MFDLAASATFLDDLNPEQRAAATHAGGPLLILAGAGTGKTTTLCARVAWLLTQGVPAERILLLTFTRRAAREMVARARALAQRAAPDSAPVLGGTFHSIAHQLVRLHASSLSLDGGFGVLDAHDAADLLDFVREEQGHSESPRRFPRAATMLDIYSRTVNAQTQLDEVLASSFPWCAEHRDALAEAFRVYVARKRALHLLDLDDLLLHWRALAADEHIGASIASAFDHVLVDEYQDVNAIQVDIVRSLGRGDVHVCAVGDDFQAIYSFRAASPRHILDFPSHFPHSLTIKLERNYRSTAPILLAANAVAAQDRVAYAKELWTEREGGEAPELCFPRDEGEQAAWVCDRVLAAREEGAELRAQGVLFRTGHDSDLLELELRRRGIPFVKYGGLRFLDAAHVKDFIALLRLLDNPADEVSWFRLLQLLDGVGPARARRALDALRAPGSRIPQLERFDDAAAHLPESAHEPAAALVAALAAAGEQDGASPGAVVELLAAALAPLVRLRYADGEARVSDLDALAIAARKAPSVRAFVSEIVLDPPSSSADLAGPPHLDEDYLVLSTVHSAKGLEWEAVHVISAYDGNFPADMSTTDEEGIAEERRLFYVALTRARRRLHVYVPARYYHRARGSEDRHGYGEASRFLTESVRALFTRSDAAPASSPAVSSRGVAPARRIEVTVEHLFG